MSVAISVNNVSKSFGNLQAVAPLDLQIEEGQFFGLLGHNGAGKTTLINMLAGLTRSDTGTLSIMGHDVQTDYIAARHAVGIVPQELTFDPFFTVREALDFQAGYYSIKNAGAWINEIMENLDLIDKANTNMRALSGGMKRRFMVAQALVHRPPVIILDEPTAGVDVELRQSLWHFIKRLNDQGHTILLTTHYLEEAERLCTEVALLRHGHLIARDQIRPLLAKYGKLRLNIGTEGDVLPALLQEKAHRLPDGEWQFDIDAASEIEPLLNTLKEAGISVKNLDVVHPDLESVFIRLMHTE